MKKFTKYIKAHIKFFILAPLFMLTEVFGEIRIPKLMSNIINIGVANRDIPGIIRTGLMMLLVCLIMIIGGVCGKYFAVRASVGFSGDLRSDLFKKIETYSFDDLDTFSTGSLITRLTNDVQMIQNMIVMGLSMAMRAPGMLIGGIIMAFGINRELGSILLIVLPLMSLCLILILRRAYPKYGKMQESLDRLNDGINESLTNVRVIKSFVREDFEKDKFDVRNKDFMDRSISAIKSIIIMFPIMATFMNVTSLLVVWNGGNMIIDGKMPVGDLTAFITYVTQILMSLLMTAMVILQSARSMASFKRVSELLAKTPSIVDRENIDRELKVEKGAIEFRSVSFSYNPEDKEKILKNISFKLNGGETLGIVGTTGSGKTSLVSLIPRLYDVDSGAVLVDGKDVREYSIHNLREGVAMVLQYNNLFSGTIEENLKWGNENASHDEVKYYASLAEADGFIEEMPMGYDTMIEQGGTNVSGGQKQRLCIARALLKKPKILILDDSTSACDTATEARINKAFKEELKDTTKIIIAQRLTSLSNADKIMVLDDGAIVDMGTHEELMNRCNEYRDIYFSQNKKGEQNGD